MVLELKSRTVAPINLQSSINGIGVVTVCECLSNFDRPRYLGQPIFRNITAVANSPI